MKKAMKVHLYSVHSQPESTKLDVALQHFSKLSIEKRTLSVGVGGQEIRLEKAFQDSDNPHLWFLDFTKSRYENGPGRISPTVAIQGFTLASNEGFGEETAALYDSKKNLIAIQYNHFGPRAGSIENYLSSTNFNNPIVYDFQIKLDLNAEAKLASKSIITKFNYKLSKENSLEKMKVSGLGLNSSLDIVNSLNGNSIEITVSIGKSKQKLSKSIFDNYLTELKKLFKGEDGIVVESLSAMAKNSESEKSEYIDLMLPKIEVEIPGLVLGAGRRYTRDSRWVALSQAYKKLQERIS
jgi:hypothetical protein